MKSLMLILQAVLKDLSTWCCTSTTADLKTISRRVEDEGLSFLTITLANFGKDFQKSLDQGFVGSDQFTGFRRSGGLPSLFSGFLCRVFDKSSGRLFDEPDIESIRAIRQITLMWAKIELPCSEQRNKKAISDYVKCEADVKAADRAISNDLLLEFTTASTQLWAEILSDVDYQVYKGEVIPSHGPGSTADSLMGNQKWNQRSWTERLDSIFSIEEMLIPNVRHHELLDRINISEPGEELPAKVILVPKTLKTPRVIAKEPTVMMFMQKAIARSITISVESYNHSRQIFGWQDRVHNMDLARQGSSDGSLATLDLSEASDRVSNQHVRALLAHYGSLREAVEACRSRKAEVPIGPERKTIIRLSKFASMGSALTFPLESIVFATIVFMGIGKTLNRPLSKKLVNEFIGRVRIFGDDLIFPVEFVPAVTSLLRTFGLVVSEDKSFWTGKFRESCGGDYYEGEDVSVVRLRSSIPTHRRNGPEIISLYSFRNQCYHAGLWNTVRHVDNVIKRLKLPLPIVESTSQALGRQSFLGYQAERTDPDLQSPLVKALVVKSTIPKNSLDGIGALHKILTRSAESPETEELIWDPTNCQVVDVGHLDRSGRPRRVDTKSRWVSPF